MDDLVGGELNSASNANYDPVDHLTTQRVNLIEGAADGKPLKSADLQTLCPAPAMPDSQNAVSTMTPSGRSRPTCSRFRDSSDSLLSVAPPRFRRTISANRVHLPHNPILLRRQEALRQTNSALRTGIDRFYSGQYRAIRRSMRGKFGIRRSSKIGSQHGAAALPHERVPPYNLTYAWLGPGSRSRTHGCKTFWFS